VNGRTTIAVSIERIFNPDGMDQTITMQGLKAITGAIIFLL
jgi:hypothetical protein